MTNVKKIIKKLPQGTIPHIHLQHSSIDSFHVWKTHSVHFSTLEAKKMWKSIVDKFPTYYKWRIIKLK